MFQEFKPHIPETFRASPIVFLANIHPALQLEVLEQVQEPEFVALDTMNYWIECALNELKKVLERVDVVVINDEEARLLSGEANLVKAGRAINQMGPSRVVIKRGEYGVLMVSRDGFFAAPGLPIEDVVDPTGAGDTFAGGFVGHLASSDTLTDDVYRQAVICGSAMASLSVEDFGLSRLLGLADEDIRRRFEAFEQLTSFKQL